MLIEEINFSVIKGKKYLNSESTKNVVEDLEHIQSELSPLLIKINDLSAKRKVYARIENDGLAKQNAQVANSSIKTIARELDEGNIDLIRKDISSLKRAIDEEGIYLKQVWRGYRDERIKSYERLLVALHNIIKDDAALDELMDLKKQIDKDDMGNAETIECVAAFVDKCKALIKSLSLDDVTEEFIIKLTNNEEITLLDLPKETYMWLEEHSLLNKIRLSF